MNETNGHEAVCPDCSKTFLTRSYKPLVRCRECRARMKRFRMAQAKQLARAQAKIALKPAIEVILPDDPWQTGQLPKTVTQNALWGG